MEIISRLFLVSVLRTMTGYAAPLLDTKDGWNVFKPVIKTACSSDGGQCWRWAPISESYDDITIATPEDGDISRLQSQRQIANPTPEFALKAWKDGALEEAGRKVRSLLPSNKRIPTRITKKDILLSRWAGSMPFSVLYMNPRPIYAVATSTTPSTPSVKHLNYQRNSSSTSPRKRYLSIPPLYFISYGWGIFGK